MQRTKSILKIVGMSIFLFLLWPIWEFWGVNMVRDIQCGPSASITKSMAEAIVLEINKIQNTNKIIDLKQMSYLPFILACGEVYMTTQNFKAKGRKFNFKQTCHYSLGDQSYKIVLEYEASNQYSHTIKYLDESAHISMTFSKIEILENDFTKLIYSASKPLIRTGKWHYAEELVLHKSINKVYEKDSNNNCKYKTPLKF